MLIMLAESRFLRRKLVRHPVDAGQDPYHAGASIGLGRFHNRAGFKHRHVGGGRDLRDYHLLRFDLLPS
jgi:hypothetical protein